MYEFGFRVTVSNAILGLLSERIHQKPGVNIQGEEIALMDLIIVVLQIALGAVLATAAIGKFMDLAGSRKAVHDFGIPKRWADPLGTVLPAAELTLAVLILPGATTRWAAIGAGLLFLAFIAGIGFNLAKGRQPDCHCFGQLHSEPAGWPTIARNAGFTLIATIIAWQGSPGPVTWFSGLSETAQIILLVGVALLALGGVQAWLLLQMWRQNTALIKKLGVTGLSTLPILGDNETAGDAAAFDARPAPPFNLPALDGDRISLTGLLRAGNPVMLLFVDPDCGPCRQLVPDIHEWVRRFSNDITVALISRGSKEENQEKFGDVLIGLQNDHEVYSDYEVRGTPSGVLVSPDGVIRDPYAPGQANIRELVVQTIHRIERPDSPVQPVKLPDFDKESDPLELLHMPTGPTIGTQGTRLPLPNIDGGYVGLDDLKGRSATLLFWGPECSFCQQILPDLKEWEEEAEGMDVQVLIVSSGTAEENRALGLRSRIVLDNAFTTGRDYSVTGTPSAIRLNESGRVASPLVVGGDAVLDMLYEQIEIGEAAMRETDVS